MKVETDIISSITVSQMNCNTSDNVQTFQTNLIISYIIMSLTSHLKITFSFVVSLLILTVSLG